MMDENPYASPAILEAENDANSRRRRPRILLASTLGLQAGGFLGFTSAIMAPLRYLWGPVPFETVLLEDLSSQAHIQILGESIFIAGSSTVFGAVFGIAVELFEKWFLPSNAVIPETAKSPWGVLGVTIKGMLFAMVGLVSPFFILVAAFSRSDPFIGLHGVWALAHMALAIYFGGRFDAACRLANSAKRANEPAQA